MELSKSQVQPNEDIVTLGQQEAPSCCLKITNRLLAQCLLVQSSDPSFISGSIANVVSHPHYLPPTRRVLLGMGLRGGILTL